MSEQHHGHPRLWMTVLLVGAAAVLVVLVGFAALEIAQYNNL